MQGGHSSTALVPTLLLLSLLGGPAVRAVSGERCTTPDPSPLEMESLPYYGDSSILAASLDEMRVLAKAQVKSAAEPGVAARIPLQFYVYRRSDGTGGPGAEELQAWVDDLNELHRENGSPLRFYRKCGIGYVDDDDRLVVSGVEGFLQTAGLTGRKAPGAVNLHVVHEIKNSGGVYNSLTDAILVEWHSDSSTIAHEVGHYLSLNHTHRGSHSPPPHRCFREPVSRNVAFSLFNVCVRPRGPRCESTGDALCDTPADPDLSDHAPNPACGYHGGVTDYRGDLYSPDTHNLMSYSRHACRDHFSTGQVGAMVSDLFANPRRPAEWLANERNAFDRFEPDNAPETARTVALGNTEERSFHWDYLGRQNGQEVFQTCDQDWVRFTLFEPTPVEVFTAELPGQPRPNTILTLYDEDLNVLASNDDAPLAGGFSRLDETLPAGTYLLRVTNKSDYPHPDSHGHYLLTVRRCLDCCFNPALGSLTSLTAQPFNLGAHAAQWTDFVPHDLVVESVALSFNADQPLDFTGPGSPPPSSHLDAHLCDGADLTVRAQGHVVVGDAGPAGLRADVHVGAGSVLALAAGGSALVHSGSRVLVEPGGRLVLDPGVLEVRSGASVVVQSGGRLEIREGGQLAVLDGGRVVVLPGGRLVYRRQARIRLEGDAALLDLRGDLEIGTGALFTFTYSGASGYVRFELPPKSCTPSGFLACPNVQVDGPSQMLFRGTSRDDKILEIAAPLHPGAALLRLTLLRGRVELAPKGEVQIEDAQLVANQVDFVGTGGGIAFDGAFAFISNQLLRFQGVGIRAHGDGSGRTLRVRSSEFTDAPLPVYSEGLRVRLERVRVSGHQFGWLAAGLVGTSEVVDSVFEGGGVAETGIDLSGGGGAQVRVVRTEINGHRFAGIFAGGGVDVGVRCGTVRDNARGFFFYDGASLDLSTLSGNGNVDAGDNLVTIELDRAADLDLRQGHNLLAPQVPAFEKFPSTVVAGSLTGPACGPPPLDATGNTWNQGVAFPGPGLVSGNVHLVHDRVGCAGGPIGLVDPAPAGPGPCLEDPPDLCGQFPFVCPFDPGKPGDKLPF